METVIAVPIAMANDRQHAASEQAVEKGERKHDQRAGARTQADRGDRRPGGAPVETVAGEHGRVRRVAVTAGLAHFAGSMAMAAVTMAVRRVGMRVLAVSRCV